MKSERSIVHWYSALALGIVLAVLVYGCSEDDEPSTQPQFVTSDIKLFWNIYDEYDGAPDSRALREDYINKGSLGLQDLATQKNLETSLKNSIRLYERYYKDIRDNSLNLSKAIDQTKNGFERLQEIFPSTQVPNVYFVIGALNAGGRVSSNGIIIAAEMFSKDDDVSLNGLSAWHNTVLRNREFLPSIVIHESIHVQQLIHTGSTSFTTVLEKSIQEGMADFVTHYILSDEPFFNDHLHTYGNSREEQIWKEFEIEMNLPYISTEWLYTGKFTDKGHPADMGYYVGYKILEAYSSTFPTITQAIESMLTTSDYKAIFERSGYEQKF